MFSTTGSQLVSEAVYSVHGEFVVPMSTEWEADYEIEVMDDYGVRRHYENEHVTTGNKVDLAYIPGAGKYESLELATGVSLDRKFWVTLTAETTPVILNLEGAELVAISEPLPSPDFFSRPKYFIEVCEGTLVVAPWLSMRVVGYADEYNALVSEVIRGFRSSPETMAYCANQDATAKPPEFQSREKIAPPETLEEAFEKLDAMFDTPEEREELIKNGPVPYHMGLGMWMRNNWGLWSGDSGIAKQLKEEYRLQHPDDMSGLILESYWLRIQGKPLEIEKQVAKYAEYWRQMGVPETPSTAIVKITTEPAHALVKHGWGIRDITPLEKKFVWHERGTGTEKLGFYARGYKPQTVTIELKPGETRELHVVLEREDTP